MAEYPTGTDLAASIPTLETAALVQEGGQKAVYKATIQGKVVAVKLIALGPEEAAGPHADADGSEEVTADEIDTDINTVVERAKREVAILDQVDVPVLARSGSLGLSTCVIDGKRWLYFTEEWIEGKTLRDILTGARLPPEQVVRLGIDLVQAICWLSRRGLVHRDIKPANVMWAADRSRFVLLDPGIALDLYGTSLTGLPVPVGTMAYLSPEQMDPSRKRGLDFRSDLFAIGVVLYEAAVAEHPFRAVGTPVHEVVAGILTSTPRPVVDRVDDFPLPLSDFIARLLGKSPHLRYRTCLRASEAIEEIANELGVT